MGRSFLRHVVLCTLALALALPWQRPSVPWPTYYQEPLDLIFSKGTLGEKKSATKISNAKVSKLDS